MMMNFGGSEGHRAANVLDLNPGSCEIGRFLRFGDDALSALQHHLWNEFVRVEQLAADGGKQSPGLRLTRIMRDISHDCVGRAERFSFRDPRDVAHSYRILSF